MTAVPLSFCNFGEFFFDEGVDADVLEADGVDHAGGGLDDAGGGVARHRFAGETFGDEAADAIERDDVFELDAVAEGAAGRDDGRTQLDAGDGDAHVGTFGAFIAHCSRHSLPLDG